MVGIMGLEGWQPPIGSKQTLSFARPQFPAQVAGRDILASALFQLSHSPTRNPFCRYVDDDCDLASQHVLESNCSFLVPRILFANRPRDLLCLCLSRTFNAGGNCDLVAVLSCQMDARDLPSAPHSSEHWPEFDAALGCAEIGNGSAAARSATSWSNG